MLRYQKKLGEDIFCQKNLHLSGEQFSRFFFFFKGKHGDRPRITSQDALRVKFNPVFSNTLSKMKCKMYRFLSLNLM